MLVAVVTLLGAMPLALAHAELRQTSPRRGATVGGEFRSVVMAFTELDPFAPQTARLFDPAGNQVPSVVARDNERLVLPIQPLKVPGRYIVEFDVIGLDGDFTSQAWTFQFDTAAADPEPITFSITGSNEGFDFITFGLLVAIAAFAAFFVQRFVFALREHRAAENAPLIDEGD